MTAVAKALEVSVGYLGEIERGSRAPLGFGRLLRLEELFGAECIDELMVIAALDRNEFALATGVSEAHDALGSALLRKWWKLPAPTLTALIAVLDSAPPAAP